MSNPPKITPKNLSYNTTLPPFLARLHASNPSSALDGRHERAIARPRRARDPNADAEDEPAYVDEATNEALSKEEVGKILGLDADERGASETSPGGNGAGGDRSTAATDDGVDRFGRRIRREEAPSVEKIEDDGPRTMTMTTTTLLSPSEERQIRDPERLAVIGAARKRKIIKAVGGASDGEEEEGHASAALAAKATVEPEEERGKGKGKGKPKGKSKKIKLSFGEDHDG